MEPAGNIHMSKTTKDAGTKTMIKRPNGTKDKLEQIVGEIYPKEKV